MNQLSTKHRKYIYLGAILVLLVPIISLGMPAGSTANVSGESDQQEGVLEQGGLLARLRVAYSLGDSNLGKVDPTSSTMNLVLLGLRGFAVNQLWMEANHNQDNKDWAKLKANVDSIILLQPHFVEVWRFQYWNLAWNVSREWDAVPDRWYWVKEGGKFMIKGKNRNHRIPEFYTDLGRVTGEKIGHADEWRFYRKYFFVDPNEELYEGGPDTGFNLRSLEDNYHATVDWYLQGNKVELDRRSRMIRVQFRKKPATAQMQGAMMRLKEGKLDEMTRQNWGTGHRYWTKEYDSETVGLGQEIFDTPTAGKIKLEAFTQADLLELKKLDTNGNFTTDQKRDAIDRLQNMIAYRYWRARAKLEQTPRMIETRKELAEGKRLFKASELDAARLKIHEGLSHLKQFIQGESGKEISQDDDMIDEIMMSIHIWKVCLKLLDKPEPASYPLKSIWDLNQSSVIDIKLEFLREFKIVVD